MTQVPALAIGSTIYWFDENRRVYHKDERGRSVGGPIWREHWRPVIIRGETSRSWIVGPWEVKIPKNKPLPRDYCADLEAIERAEWVVHNSHRIVRAVEDITRGFFSYDEAHVKLRAIAQVVGYKEAP